MPVKQLAFPLLTNTAETFPFSTTFLVYITGAATILFDVNTAEASLFSLTITATPYFPSLAPATLRLSITDNPPSSSLNIILLPYKK